MVSASLHRPREADFFTSQIIQNGGLSLFQFGIKIPVIIDHRLGDLGEEGIVQPDLRAKTRGAADDHAGDVIATRVAGDDAIGDEERGRTDVIADDAIGREVSEHFFFAVTGETTQHFKRIGEEIGLVIRVHALQHGHDALEAHAGVHMFLRERLEATVIEKIVLNENVVPEFEIARAFAVHAAAMRLAAQVIELLAAIQMNLGTGPAWTGLCHLPEIIFATEK